MIGTFLNIITYAILLAIAFVQFISFRKTRQKINSFAWVFPVGEKDKITNFLNSYVENCKKNGFSPQLSEAKKIVEEHLEKLEDAINRSLITPLYLGLMGTAIGVIFGFLKYVISKDISNAIDYIIGSVGISMFVTALGLFYTIWNSALKFSSAKDKVEEGKQDYYNENLIGRFTSSVEDGLAGVVNEMRVGLDSFNRTLSANLERMDIGFKSAIESTMSIQQMDFKPLKEVLNKINTTVNNFEKLDKKFTDVNEYLETMTTLFEKIKGLDPVIESTQSIEKMTKDLNSIANQMNNNFSDTRTLADENSKTTKKLLDYLESNREALETINKSAQATALGVETDVKNLNKNITESIEKTENIFNDKWDKTHANMLDTFTKMRINLEGFGACINELNGKLEQSIETQVTSITNSFDRSFSPFVGHIKSLTEKVINTDLQKMVDGTVITEMERIIGEIKTSFDTHYESIKQWKCDIAMDIKSDVENKIKIYSQDESEAAIETLKCGTLENRKDTKKVTVMGKIIEFLKMDIV